MQLSDDISKLLIQLIFKVLTPIMIFVLIIFGGTVYFIFLAQERSPSFNFNAAFWVWLVVCLGFTPLCGAIMWHQSVKAIGVKKKKSSKRTPKSQQPPTSQNQQVTP